MLYNFAADSFHTKKLCSRLSSRELRLQRGNGRFASLSPPLGDLGATQDDHLRLVGKRVEDFLLVLIKLFSLGRTAEAPRAIIGSKSAISLQRGGRLTQNLRQKGSTPADHSSSQKTRLNVFFVWYKNLNIYFLRFVTMHAFDGQTDRRTDRILFARPRLHSMQRGKKVQSTRIGSPLRAFLRA